MAWNAWQGGSEVWPGMHGREAQKCGLECMAGTLKCGLECITSQARIDDEHRFLLAKCVEHCDPCNWKHTHTPGGNH